MEMNQVTNSHTHSMGGTYTLPSNQSITNELTKTEGQEIDKETGDGKTYTQEEMAVLLQKEADRRVTAALEKQKRDYEKKLSLVNLDEKQREAAEKDMRIQELQEQLKSFNIEKNKSELKSVLGSRGLSPQFADLIEIGDDITEAQARIDTLDRLFKNAVAEEVKRRIAGGTPKSGSISTTGDLTKESFNKMTLAQKSELYSRDPELFNKFTK